jgi:RimJ/RimL family protein N-acetyltransferase
MIPTLHTKRLTLRPPVLADADAYAEILMSDRAIHMGGPFTREDAELDFCAGVAGWHLRGFGALSLCLRTNDTFLGLMFMHHEFGDPERELGWILTPDAEGQGFGFEAGSYIRDYVFETLGWETAVSYIHPDNTRSVTLAKRLGAILDPKAEKPPEAPDCLVYRHAPADNDGSVEAYA